MEENQNAVNPQVANANANANANAKVVTTNDIWRTDYKLTNRKIVSVTPVIENGKTIRIRFTLNGEPFISYKQGEKIITNSFSVSVKRINDVFGAKGATYIAAANAYTSVIPSPFIVQALTNATITLKRVFKAKGEKIEYDDAMIYDNDTFTNEVESVEESPLPINLILMQKKLEKWNDESDGKEKYQESAPNSNNVSLGLKLVW